MTDPTIDKAALEAMLPCPFCGGTASVVKNSFPPPTRRFPGYFHPTCNADHGDCPGIIDEQDEQGGTACDFKTETEAIAAWNRRAPTTDGVRVTVRELEWHPIMLGSTSSVADASFGEYTVEHYTEAATGDGWLAIYEDNRKLGYFGTEAEAKAAAQADYAARIMSAVVVTHPAPVAAQPAEGWVTVPRDLERGLLERLAGRWGYTLEETADAYSVMVEVMASSPTAMRTELSEAKAENERLTRERDAFFDKLRQLLCINSVLTALKADAPLWLEHAEKLIDDHNAALAGKTV